MTKRPERKSASRSLKHFLRDEKEHILSSHTARSGFVATRFVLFIRNGVSTERALSFEPSNHRKREKSHTRRHAGESRTINKSRRVPHLSACGSSVPPGDYLAFRNPGVKDRRGADSALETSLQAGSRSTGEVLKSGFLSGAATSCQPERPNDSRGIPAQVRGAVEMTLTPEPSQ